MIMEVILREDIDTLGKAGTVVRVKPGYARNYLLPRGLAYEATEGNKKRIAAESRARESRQAEDRAKAVELAARLETIALTIPAKAGEGERLFGSITSQDIAAALEQAGQPIDKRRIELPHPIKTVGQHVVPVRLHPEVQATIRLTVVPA
jgi:large subunit ribosomal protein L9